jgi:hypothetical protein
MRQDSVDQDAGTDSRIKHSSGALPQRPICHPGRDTRRRKVLAEPATMG